MSIKLADIRTEFEKYIVIKDKWAIDMVLATILGNALLPRDPVWTMIIAPSSGGKSTLMAPCAGIKAIHFLDDLTEKTFLSGYKIKGKEASLLKIIGSGVMCFSDFTAVLSKNPLTRGEILGQLRLVYDGSFSKRTGTGEITWKGKMGLLGACTPEIYHILEGARAMGERFIYYTLDQPTDDEIVRKQEQVNMSSRAITEIMQPLYKEYVEDINEYITKNGIPDLKLTPEQQERVHDAAKFCVMAKATVHLDFKTNKPDALVSRPGVGRDRKMFNTLLHMYQIMDAYEIGIVDQGVLDERIDLICKVAYSSVTRERRKILEILSTYDRPMSSSEIGATDDFGLQKEGIEKYLHVLFAVGLIQKDTKGNMHKWFIDNPETKKFVRKVAGIVPQAYILTEEAEVAATEDIEFDQYGT